MSGFRRQGRRGEGRILEATSLVRLGVDRPFLSLALAGLITLGLSLGLLRLRVDNSMEQVLPADSAAMTANRMVRETFGSREAVFVGLVAGGDAFTVSTLSKLERLTRLLEQMTLLDAEAVSHLREQAERLPPKSRRRLHRALSNGSDGTSDIPPEVRDAANDGRTTELETRLFQELEFRQAPFDDVLSLSSTKGIEATEDGLEIRNVMERLPGTESELAALRQRVLSDRLLSGALVSRDATSLSVLGKLSFNPDDWPELASEITAKVLRATDRLEGPEEIYVSGVPVVNTLIMEAVEKDLAFFVPFVVIVLAGVMFVSFRRWRATLMPIVVVLVALVWSLGLMGLLGRPITIISSTIPVMILAVGIADGVHVIAHHLKRLGEGLGPRQELGRTVDDLAAPIVMTSLTTATGFASLSVSELSSIRDFGLFTAFGTLAALVATFWVLPALIRLVGLDSQPRRAGAGPSTLLDRLAVRGVLYASTHRRSVIVGCVALSAVAIAAAAGLKVGSKMTGNFRETTEIFRAGEMLNDKFGGTQVLELVVDTGRNEAAKDPAVLEWIAGLQRHLEESPTIGYSLSLADLIRRMNLVMHDEDPAFDRVPRTTEVLPGSNGEPEEVRGRDQIEQYLLLYESGGGEDLEESVDFDYRRLRVTVQIRGDDHAVSRAAKTRALEYIDAHPPPGSVTFAGCANNCVFADELIIPSQLRSLATAVVLVTVLLGFLFRDVRLAVLSIAPILVTIALAFGGMRLVGVSLDVATAMFASIMLGIGVDYSVHLLSWYRRGRGDGQTHEAALATAAHHTGRPILLNALAVSFGLLVLTVSSFRPVILLGGFLSATLLVSAAACLTLIPALLKAR